MTPISESTISPLWQCRIERIPLKGYSVTEWASGNVNFPSSDKDCSDGIPVHSDGSPMRITERVAFPPKNIPFSNDDALDLIGKIEKDFPSVNSSLIRKRIRGKMYLIVGTVWTPPQSNDCFLIKWYEDKPVFPKLGVGIWCSSLLLVLFFSIVVLAWSIHNDYLPLQCVQPACPQVGNMATFLGGSSSPNTEQNEESAHNPDSANNKDFNDAVEKLLKEYVNFYNPQEDDEKVVVKYNNGLASFTMDSNYKDYRQHIENDAPSLVKNIFSQLRIVQAEHMKIKNQTGP